MIGQNNEKGNLILGYASWGFREPPPEKQLQIVHRDGLDVLELGIHGHENGYLQLSPTDEQIETINVSVCYVEKGCVFFKLVYFCRLSVYLSFS